MLTPLLSTTPFDMPSCLQVPAGNSRGLDQGILPHLVYRPFLRMHCMLHRTPPKTVHTLSLVQIELLQAFAKRTAQGVACHMYLIKLFAALIIHPKQVAFNGTANFRGTLRQIAQPPQWTIQAFLCRLHENSYFTSMCGLGGLGTIWMRGHGIACL